LGNNIHFFEWRDEDVAKTDDLDIVSRIHAILSVADPYVLVLQMLQELELTIGPLG
jgi:hypothetical protein